jgi:hypothetical protein
MAQATIACKFFKECNVVFVIIRLRIANIAEAVPIKISLA